ncbi:MAG: hypothetical protein NTZ67_08000 [Gammaproteobacteria bacterium]|nr:hypothetical protein [Gammaproteobacteria bacterium]
MSKIIEKLKKLINLEKIKTYFKDNKSSFENLNTFIKKKQNLWGCVVILSFLIIVFVLHELAKSKANKTILPVVSQKNITVPDGVLSNDFSEKNSLSALEEQQQQIDQLNKHVEKLTDEFGDKNKTNSDILNNKNNVAAFPMPGSATTQNGVVPQSSLTGVNIQSSEQLMPTRLTTQTFSYHTNFNAARRFVAHSSDSMMSNKNSQKEEDDKTPKTWVPAGTFDRAVLLVGADANASVNGQSDTSPILMRFLDSGTLPNGFHSHLKGCFALASIYGDISSERGEARLNKLSCTKKDGSILEIPVQGFIAFAGKEGIRGIPVMRNGKILTMAGISGALSGFGSALAQGAQTQSISPLGTTTTVTGSQVFQSGAYTGASTAMGQLASYYIKRADQYHPIISIGSGTVSTVVFQTGFSLVPKTDSNQATVGNNQTAPENTNNNASEIKSLLSQAQTTTQKTATTGNSAFTDGTADEMSQEPFSNISQTQLGQSTNSTASGDKS